MTLRLTVHTAAWRQHVNAVAAQVDGLVPVVKGNGYGFGRLELAGIAGELSDTVAVGSVHELAGLPTSTDAVVLTPALAPPAVDAIMTVASTEHVDALAGWSGRVVVKVTSSMRRYGAAPGAELDALTTTARRAGLDVVGSSIHPPLAGTDDDHLAEIASLLPACDPAVEVWVSHLTPDAYRRLPTTHRYRLRLGTALWHGDKSTLQLTAEVLATRRVRGGDSAGYRLPTVPGDGWLVMIGAGSAHGVAPLDGGMSPFHHRRRRIDLVEPPHMHTSMAFVPDGEPVPAVGERVDVQRPLITTTVDVVDWV